MKQEKQYNYIYKTICTINNTYYIGMHSTNNIHDGYYGSGLRLQRSIKKYGKENHILQILEYLPNRTTLALREKEIVNESLLKDELCLNLAQGGHGGNVGFAAYNQIKLLYPEGIWKGKKTYTRNKRKNKKFYERKTRW